MRTAIVEALGALDGDGRADALRRCCGSDAWVAAVLEGWPYPTDDELEAAAEDAWWGLSESEWLEAFSAHPRIGETDAADPWSSTEQSGIEDAAADTLSALAEANRAYEERFGHVFLICATGLEADQMLGALRRRLGNDPSVELQVAASEQARITQLRLARLAPEEPGTHPAGSHSPSAAPVEAVPADARVRTDARADSGATAAAGEAPTLSTHVLDTTAGRPAAGLEVELTREVGDRRVVLAGGTTDEDGRIASFVAPRDQASEAALDLSPGTYRLRFDTGAYFARTRTEAFHPFVEVAFVLEADGGHYHVPLLLSPYGYTTYRGS